MSFENKGSMPATVVISLDPDRSGNFVADGAADDVTFQLANDYVSSLGGGLIHTKPGTYLFDTAVNPSDNVDWEGEGYATHLKIVDGRPTGAAGDWIAHCLFNSQGYALDNATFRDMRLDGNKANQGGYPGAITHGTALIYVGSGGSHIRTLNCYMYDHIRFGGLYIANTTDLFDCIASLNTVLDCGYNGLGFNVNDADCYSSGFYSNFVHGMGDIGLNTFKWAGATGSFYGVEICDNITYLQDGVDGSSADQWGIRVEDGENVLVANNALYKENRGIGDDAESTGNRYLGNLVMIRDVDQGQGITIHGSHSIIEDNTIVGDNNTTNMRGIMSDIDANDNRYLNNRIDTFSTGIRLRGSGEEFGKHWIVNCTNKVGWDTANAPDAKFLEQPFSVCAPIGTAGWITTSPSGIEVDAADEGALALGWVPYEADWVGYFKVLGVALAAPGAGNAMRLEFNANAGKSVGHEAWDTEQIRVADKPCTEDNAIINDVLEWSFNAPDDDVDIDDLEAGEAVEMRAMYEAAGNGDIATDALITVIVIGWM